MLPPGGLLAASVLLPLGCGSSAASGAGVSIGKVCCSSALEAARQPRVLSALADDRARAESWGATRRTLTVERGINLTAVQNFNREGNACHLYKGAVAARNSAMHAFLLPP